VLAGRGTHGRFAHWRRARTCLSLSWSVWMFRTSQESRCATRDVYFFDWTRADFE
jgi:hypothetical protein